MFHGVTVALVTPLTGAGEVGRRDVARLVASVRPHVDALLPALSTGEGWALSDRQWHDMVEATVGCADGLPVLAGIEVATTHGTVRRARAAARLGARAVAATTPYGADVSQDEMYRHYARIADASGLPVVVYHESEISRNTIAFDTLLRICRLPSVVAVKDSAGDPLATRRLIAARPGVGVLQGLEHLVTSTPGVDGYVMALANLEPGLCAAMYRAPCAERAAELAAACARHGLDRPDWYRAVKSELRRRSILTSDATVDPGCPEGTPV
ncbi:MULTISPECIES: dihydrodipicolinate synthase family protein [Streptomycetaceae]|uniref:Dihydrodipicolinate synthetase protein n=1 Tax=Streptantibioticus cattleyicolor (strain ATCC 35852 / DSM 46488 / JCM 4925 / NBRC 14057 / NRRL 8057) TaxID=1003195 RepID=F8JVZ6_STREN|nr:dihydrodipicolinate synthase family protein [Streptantibioticus cattleyicolor]AEW92766.1 dihydrodipicolinate synthetase protein [Streptantibioticus cattleyicolor NRRL 8057 = DSM 46488]MYS57530.1 dihydrodipicolinate synthase family protein [Streptomyces sp. SID5468]CCB73121.1 Dihydrodipicolinate synthetase protein [Streptantibioticus cattleyicolor NRRL 8057 = DSM 46488]